MVSDTVSAGRLLGNSTGNFRVQIDNRHAVGIERYRTRLMYPFCPNRSSFTLGGEMKKKYGLESVRSNKRDVAIRCALIASAFIVISGLSFFAVRFIRNHIFNTNSIESMYSNWDLHTKEGYSNVYKSAKAVLEKEPFHNTALSFLGYSAFMLAESEPDNIKSQELLDESIFGLRKAMRNCNEEALPQIQYMLGRAYFYKNKISSYNYYADLVVKYLSSATALGYQSSDIPLLLGLSYADLSETDKSIAAFTEALSIRESDTLLFNIAKQYCVAGQDTVAQQYLVRVINTSQNEDLRNESHVLLAQILINEGEFDEAEKNLNTVLEKNDNYVDAHYELGVVYEQKGDNVKARAEWRKCLRIQANHPGALRKLSGEA